ncbi:MAG: hypothetical protein GXO22_01790 [Aquificae bacterium]|nr:hypothetical protein [Aquificota bacterium]
MKKNLPFIVITGLGIFATLFLLYFFVYNMAVSTVREAIFIERAYPNVKPEEYVNELKYSAQKNNLSIVEIKNENMYYLVQMYDESVIDKLAQISPNLVSIGVVNLVVYSVGNGTGLVANNPYLWDIAIPSSYVDDLAENFSNQLVDIFDGIYWQIREKKKEL